MTNQTCDGRSLTWQSKHLQALRDGQRTHFTLGYACGPPSVSQCRQLSGLDRFASPCCCPLVAPCGALVLAGSRSLDRVGQPPAAPACPGRRACKAGCSPFLAGLPVQGHCILVQATRAPEGLSTQSGHRSMCDTTVSPACTQPSKAEGSTAQCVDPVVQNSVSMGSTREITRGSCTHIARPINLQYT